VTGEPERERDAGYDLSAPLPDFCLCLTVHLILLPIVVVLAFFGLYRYMDRAPGLWETLVSVMVIVLVWVSALAYRARRMRRRMEAMRDSALW